MFRRPPHLAPLFILGLLPLLGGCQKSILLNGEDGGSTTPDTPAATIVTPSHVSDCSLASSVHVAKTGANTADCGTQTAPCLTIAAGLNRASTGQTVCVHAGIWQENWITIKSGTWLVSADGTGEAKIYSGNSSAIRLCGISNAGIEGFEVYGNWDQGTSGDGLIRVLDSTGITILNTIAHDAPADQDVVKVSGQIRQLVIDGLIAWNPARRTSDLSTYQEVVDIFGSGGQLNQPPPVSDVVLRNSWLFQIDGKGDWLVYSKINAEKILYENNVFGPSTNTVGNSAVGIGTGETGIPDATAAVVTHAIVRNNIFAGTEGDSALTVSNSDDTWIYNNTFWRNSGTRLRSVIMFRGNGHAVGDTRIFNNIFAENNPSKDGNGMFFWNRNTAPAPWWLDWNLYWNNIAVTNIPYTAGTHSIYDRDPLLVAPVVPLTDASHRSFDYLRTIRDGFRLQKSSPALGAGTSATAVTGHPDWSANCTRAWNIFGNARTGSVWDLGASESAP